MVRALRANELFRRILDVDPELLLPYLLDRRGRSPAADPRRCWPSRIARGQAAGAVRAGDPQLLARALLLAAHGFALSAPHDDRRRASPRPTSTPSSARVLARGRYLHAMTTDAARGSTPGVAGIADRTEVDLARHRPRRHRRGRRPRRGLPRPDVLAVDAHDIAFGTSRWSSKLVHGGLRYLAKGQLGVAHESAVERGILMERTAPHLTHALPWLLPLMSERLPRPGRAWPRPASAAGDLLRRSRAAPPATPSPGRAGSPAPRRSRSLPALRSDGPARRTAVTGTASSRTTPGWSPASRAPRRPRRATSAPGPGCWRRPGRSATLRDELHRRDPHRPRPRGRQRHRRLGRRTWSTTPPAPEPRHPPGAARGHPPRPDRAPSRSRCPARPTASSSLLPQPDGTIYVGLTDEPVDGDDPGRPRADRGRDRLPARRGRPPRSTAAAPRGRGRGVRRTAAAARQPTAPTADLSRKHAVLTSRQRRGHGRRRQAHDVPADGRGRRRRAPAWPTGRCLHPRRCRCSAPPPRASWPGSRRRRGWSAGSAPRRRWSSPNARRVTGLGDDELLAPVAPHLPATLAELVFGVTHEGAADVDDLLDRRTRIGLVPEDRETARPAAERSRFSWSPSTGPPRCDRPGRGRSRRTSAARPRSR